jgi:zinc/manganese transport system permease protein
MEVINILLYPFLACVLIVLIHTYFGIHILERGIIFVDLALAQFIGLGIAVSFLLGHDTSDIYLFSLLFAFLGAFVLSFSKNIARLVYIEAFIGVFYIFSFAASILILDRTPHGFEEFKTLLNGNIIWINSKDVLRLLLVYLVIGIFHFVFRKRFLGLSYEGHRNFLWEFLFFLSFALVLVNSVHMAGIIQVFAFLIVPALIGKLFTKKPHAILLTGWIIGLLATIFGITVSYVSDLPTSPLIVASLSITFIVCLSVKFAFQKN